MPKIFTHWWLPIISTVSVVAILILLLPRHGVELVERWGEDKKQHIGQSYAHSQYVKGETGQNIDDATLYLYAGLAYTQGQDPATINFEHPPLGKYLWGVSWLVFGNPFLLNVAVVVFILLAFYYLGRKLTLAPWLLVIGQGLLALVLQPQSLMYSLLDYQLLLWTLVFFILILWNKETWLKYTLLGLVVGSLVTIKYPLPNILPYLAILLWQTYKAKTWKFLLVTAVLASGVYLGSYWSYFTAGHNLLNFLQFEKYRFDWWTGDRPMRWYLIWQILFTGSFQSWWEEGWHRDNGWNMVLPVAFVISTLVGGVATWRNGIKKAIANDTFMMWFFSLMMMGLYTIGSGNAVRYLLIVFPIWYIVAVKWLKPSAKMLATKFKKLKPSD